MKDIIIVEANPTKRKIKVICDYCHSTNTFYYNDLIFDIHKYCTNYYINTIDTHCKYDLCKKKLRLYTCSNYSYKYFFNELQLDEMVKHYSEQNCIKVNIHSNCVGCVNCVIL